jgi:hypothetical protein
MQQDAGARQMPQKLMPETSAFSRTFDKPRNIGNHETAAFLDAYHAEVRMQRGKWIVRHLGARIRHRAQKCGFTGIGHAEQTDIGQHLKLKGQRAMFAGLARRGAPRRTIGARLETRVAEPTLAAMGHQHCLAMTGHFTDQFFGFGVRHPRAERHLYI